MDYKQKSIALHSKLKGKIEIISRVKVDNKEALATAYTPGVAEPCLQILKNNSLSYDYTRRANLVAVISDGSAVLGLGNIGGLAGMPVMEGKAVLFKEFADIDAFPICLDTQDTEEIIGIIKALSISFGGINLEDISSPRCFEIERRLIDELNIPVFHDDQHGTAIVVMAGLINALKLVNKNIEDVKIVISGPGAAGTAIARLIYESGAKNIVMCDEYGILYPNRKHMEWHKKELASLFNKNGLQGDLSKAVYGADVFIGVSASNILNENMVRSMNKDAIIFAMANPTPEIMPDIAFNCGAKVVGTGRSDFDNQINNVLAFPGVFRGALDAKATKITPEMKLSASYAIAELISNDELCGSYVIPKPFDKRVVDAVAKAVKQKAIEQGVIRK